LAADPDETPDASSAGGADDLLKATKVRPLTYIVAQRSGNALPVARYDHIRFYFLEDCGPLARFVTHYSQIGV
jgi:hypothetical protein